MGRKTSSPADESGAREGLDEIRDRVGAFDTTLAKSPQAVRAELIGSDQCRAAGLNVRAAAPVLAICRKLVAAGVDSRRPLCAYRAGVLCLKVRSIGEGARLTTKERPFGPVFESWTPFPTPPVAPPMRAMPQRRARGAQ